MTKLVDHKQVERALLFIGTKEAQPLDPAGGSSTASVKEVLDEGSYCDERVALNPYQLRTTALKVVGSLLSKNGSRAI
jgi:hypothetical protein